MLHADGPTLVCDSAYFKLGAQNVQLVCEGTMHPAPTYSTWWWGKKPDRTVLNTGDTIEGFTAGSQVRGLAKSSEVSELGRHSLPSSRN